MFMILKPLLNTRMIWMIFINIEKYNPNKKREILIVIDDMIAYMLSNENPNPIVTELLVRVRELNIYLVFMTQFLFVVPKDIRLNSTHYFIIKIPNKQDFQHNAFNHSSDIDFRNFVNFYKKCATKPYYFLVIDATLAQIILYVFEKESCRRNTKK